jgi:hypothetical protein
MPEQSIGSADDATQRSQQHADPMNLPIPWRRSLAAASLTLLVAACAAQSQPSGSQTAAPSPSAERSDSPLPSQPAAPSEPSAPIVVEWQAAAVPETANATGIVAVAPGGDGLIAIGNDGGFGSILWTSGDDGGTWRDVTPAGFEAIGLIGMVEHDGMLVAVGRGNTIDVEAEEAAVYLSDDGLEWRKVETAEQLIGQMIDVISTDDGLFAVGGMPGADSAAVWHSTDGEAWERIGEDFEHAFLWAIAEGGPGLVAVGWERDSAGNPHLAAWTSADAVEWTKASDPEGFEGAEATDVVATPDGRLLMTGSAFDGSGGRFWTSADGTGWELVGELTDGGWARSLTITPAGVVAGGGGEDMAARSWLFPDAHTVEPLADPLPGAYFHALHPTDETLLAMGATQAGTLETGIQAHATIWFAELTD